VNYLAALTQRLMLLERQRAAFRPHAKHLVPDLMLMAFVDGLIGACTAVKVLGEARKADLAYPNARATIEFAQNALMLVTSDDYDLSGCHAYLFFTRIDHSLMDSSSKQTGEVPLADNGEEFTFDKAVAELRANWAAFSPGQELVVDRALATLRPPRAKPENWHGLNPAAELPRRLAKLLPPGSSSFVGDGVEEMMKHTYSFMSRSSHVHLRLGLRGLGGKPNDYVTPRVESMPYEEMSVPPLAVAGGSAGHMLSALMLRGRIGNT
jgi:hypothetical protein